MMSSKRHLDACSSSSGISTDDLNSASTPALTGEQLPDPSSEASWQELWPAIFGNEDDVMIHTETRPESDTAFDALHPSQCALEDSLSSDVYPDTTQTGSQIEAWTLNSILDAGSGATLDSRNDDLITRFDDDMKCFGMLRSIDARLCNDMSSLQSRLVQIRSDFVPLRVAVHEDLVLLLLEDGETFAQLAETHKVPFETISGFPSINLEAFADTRSTLRCLRKAYRRHDARIKVNVNVYGSETVRHKLGCTLSAFKLYLQHPLHHKSAAKYDNPHLLTFDDLDAGGARKNTELLSTPPPVLPSPIEHLAREVINTLTNDRDFQGMEADSRVKTPLLPHQERALEFMIRKEHNDYSPGPKLWQTETHGDSTGFRHVVTGLLVSACPKEVCSGILADDTGMGKTLSTLSLVAKTLEDARIWSREEAQTDVNQVLRSRATVIVLSSILIMNGWEKQIAEHLNGCLKVVKYHGKRRSSVLAEVADADIVLTTYHTLAAEQRHKKQSLYTVNWFRVVLDEAHTIRRQSTTLFTAVATLNTSHRWCLTATPIQNKLEDLGSLLAFLQAEPLDRPSTFRKHIVTPFWHDKEDARKRLAKICNSFCLRRDKSVLKLPPLQQHDRFVTLSVEERLLYDRTFSAMKRALSHGSRHKFSGTPFGKFQIQLQLRLLCNHGTFQSTFSGGLADEQTQKEEMINSVSGPADVICCCCLQRTPLYASTCASKVSQSCQHIVCDECELELAESDSVNLAAPPCRLCPQIGGDQRPLKRFRTSSAFDGSSQRHFDPNGSSSKISALMSDVSGRLNESKSIVFSGWTRSLDLVKLHLDRLSIACVRIDGSVELNQRQRILDRFERDSQIRILLMTTGTGAFGLNLTIANRIFILEPQWNPSVEAQAISRAQRYLQKQNVEVIRYLMKDTVEGDIRKQQQTKIDYGNAGFQAGSCNADNLADIVMSDSIPTHTSKREDNTIVKGC